MVKRTAKAIAATPKSDRKRRDISTGAPLSSDPHSSSDGCFHRATVAIRLGLGIFLRLAVTTRADSFKENRRRFIFAAFAAREFGFRRDELATKCFGENRLRELFGARRRHREALLDRIGEFEQRLYPPGDLALLFEGRNRQNDRFHS